MYQFLYGRRILTSLHFHERRKLVLGSLVLASLLGALGTVSAQPRDPACQSYAARCQGNPNAPLCSQLKQRCGGGADAYIQAPGGGKTEMPQLDHPTDMPDCGPNEEMVMVPTCQCGSPMTTGDAGGDTGGCAACTSDGVRMVCQPAQ